jgi:peptidoglycan/xylan/chitin deacetylase (PgdA/CDA1 family)
LFYHRVLPERDPLMPEVLWAEPFDMQLGALSRVFNVLRLEDAVSLLKAGKLPERAVCLTFDDGYLDNLKVAVPIIKKHGLHATFFLTSGYLGGGLMFNDIIVESVRRMKGPTVDLGFVGLGVVRIDDLAARVDLAYQLDRTIKYLAPDERKLACERVAALASEPLPSDLMMSSDDVRALVEAGMSVGGHTVDHPILSRIPREDAEAQILKNREALAEVSGHLPAAFAYPNGRPGVDYGAEHIDMVRHAGFSCALSTAWGVATRHSDIFQLPRISPRGFNQLSFVLRLQRFAWAAT